MEITLKFCGGPRHAGVLRCGEQARRRPCMRITCSIEASMNVSGALPAAQAAASFQRWKAA